LTIRLENPHTLPRMLDRSCSPLGGGLGSFLPRFLRWLSAIVRGAAETYDVPPRLIVTP